MVHLFFQTEISKIFPNIFIKKNPHISEPVQFKTHVGQGSTVVITVQVTLIFMLDKILWNRSDTVLYKFNNLMSGFQVGSI